MKRLTVRIRAAARDDLREIYEWIVARAGRPQHAGRLIDRILDCCGGLAEFPMKGRARDDLLPGLRLLPFEKTVTIAYRIDGNHVDVTNIYYRGRDFEADLAENTGRDE